MERRELECCRRLAAHLDAGGQLPFALTGARATFAPDRVVDVRHIKVEVALDFEHCAVEGVCTQTLSPINDGPARVVLDAVEMTIHAVTLSDGEALEFSYDGKSLAVD